MTSKTIDLDNTMMPIILAGVRALREEVLMKIETADPSPQFAWQKQRYEELAKQQLDVIQHLLTVWHTKGKGICPVCHGFGMIRIPPDSRKWYPETHFHKCRNCGGQYQGGITHLNLGTVALHRVSGLPCSHDYTYTKLGNCYHGYTCKNCGDSHNVDSGD